MRRRIFAAGMRPINAVVDATNYVMLETGQPIHAFDAARVRDGIVVRRARPGEEITLLDGSTRRLDEEMLVIADEERGLVIAGVMGAEDAEVGEETTDALIEVANFEGRNILQTSQKLGLRTDASGRFERGLDPNMVDFAMDRVTALLSRNPGDTSPKTPSATIPSRWIPGTFRCGWTGRHSCSACPSKCTRRSNGSGRWGARSSGKTGDSRRPCRPSGGTFAGR